MYNTLTYTEKHDVTDSTAVKAVYYNDKTRELGVSLVSGGTYVYDKVPAPIKESLLAANSKGGAYAGVKKHYGPGRSVSVTQDAKDTIVASPAPNATNYYPLGATTVTGASITALPVTKAVPVAASASGKTVVDFRVNGNLRTFTVDTTSQDEAVEALNTAAQALGVLVTLVKVTVTY